jgi:hypothetical protein
MTLAGFILGVINIAIVAALLLLLGALVVWLFKLFGFAPPDQQVQRIYLLVVLLIVIYMIAALLLGMPSLHIVPHAA